MTHPARHSSVVAAGTSHGGASQSRGASFVKGVVVAVASIVLGGLTSYAQGALPDSLASFANSASGWTLLTALLVAWTRFRLPLAAVAAAVSFVLLVVGYAVASHLRGFHYDPTRWAVIGVITGPFVGAATAWLRERGVRAALGSAVLAAVGIGEAIRGLTTLRETTSAVYWSLAGALGLGLLVLMLVRRIRGLLPSAIAVGATVAGSGLVIAGYRMLDAI